MGTYYYLSCRQCRQYVHFGKKIHQDNKEVLQGMCSENTDAWISDERVWHALQAFLFEHRSHPLVFDNDEHDNTIDNYIEIELDALTKIK